MSPSALGREPADNQGIQAANPHSATTRRKFCETVVSGAGLLLATGYLPDARALSDDQVASTSLDVEKDSDLLRAHVKMRYSTGPEFCMGWLRGKRLAYSEGRIEPLCGMLAATYARRHRVSENEFEFVLMEVTFYTDYETGELIRTLKMPFSGEEVEVPVHRFGPQLSRFAVKLDESTHFVPKPGTTEGEFASSGTVAMNKSISKNYVLNGELVLQHEEYGRRYPENSDRPTMFYRESTIWSAPLAEVIDPARHSVASRLAYSAMTSWRPWMKMGDIPGHTSSNGFGGRAFSFEELPADYRSFLQQEHPDVFENAEGLLDGFSG